MPEFGPSCRSSTRTVKYILEDGLVGVENSRQKIGGNVRKCMTGLKGNVLLLYWQLTFFNLTGGFYRRLQLCHRIWPYMFSIFLAYLVTLSLFPGIESEIQSCSLGDWMPVVLMTIFNFMDLIGKVQIMKSKSQYFGVLIFRCCLALSNPWLLLILFFGLFLAFFLFLF